MKFMQQIHSPEYFRTNGQNSHFKQMVNALDEDLYLRNGEGQKQYDKYNKIDNITNAIVLFVDKKPVGCGCFKRFDADTVEMKRMFVFPEMRGKLLGAKLLQELEAWAVEEGFSKAVLETGVKQVEAHRLYHKAGYFRTENYGQYLGMEDSICFGKDLK